MEGREGWKVGRMDGGWMKGRKEDDTSFWAAGRSVRRTWQWTLQLRYLVVWLGLVDSNIFQYNTFSRSGMFQHKITSQ